MQSILPCKTQYRGNDDQVFEKKRLQSHTRLGFRVFFSFVSQYKTTLPFSSNSAPGRVVFCRTLQVRCPMQTAGTRGSSLPGIPFTEVVF